VIWISTFDFFANITVKIASYILLVIVYLSHLETYFYVGGFCFYKRLGKFFV